LIIILENTIPPKKIKKSTSKWNLGFFKELTTFGFRQWKNISKNKFSPYQIANFK